MRRAGFGVWLAYDLEGSFEQNPPSLIDELIRDRRWCQGNLQHFRLIFTRGFFPTHRALFINGIMSYGSALLWFLFLAASSVQAIAELLIVPNYFPSGPSLFPDWPKYFPNWALTLLSGTALLLFLPKVLAVVLVTAKGGARAFVGFFAMNVSMLLEVLISTFLAPVRMLFHSFFVVSALLGQAWGWNAQNRDDSGTSWLDAVRFHWWGTALGIVWGGLMYFVNPGFFLWLSPIVVGLALSVPLSVWTSRVGIGEGTRKMGLFLTPADTVPTPEILRLEENLRRPPPYSPFPLPREKGFVRAVVIPRVFALHTTLVNHRRRNSPQKLARLRELRESALLHGPEKLTRIQKIAILSDPECLEELHRAVWELDDEKAALWGIR
jgi:membrane glycosyltransferase